MSIKKLLAAMAALLFTVTLFAAPASAAAEVVDSDGDGTVDTVVSDVAFGGSGLGTLGKALGLGLIILGAGRGIGMIGSHSVDATARQPEAAGNIFQSSIILAALIEGATLFAIVAVAFFA